MTVIPTPLPVEKSPVEKSPFATYATQRPNASHAANMLATFIPHIEERGTGVQTDQPCILAQQVFARAQWG
jgi:hypothetical protein